MKFQQTVFDNIEKGTLTKIDVSVDISLLKTFTSTELELIGKV